VLDAGTFDELLESRREGLFVRDGSWHQLARAYRTVQLISLTAGFVLVAVAAPIIAAVTGTGWVWIPAGALLVVLAITLILTPRQIRSFGYRLRENDLVLFQRVVAVPYGRMQLVDITHGPLDRAFGIAQLKLVTAAAASAVVIPGLTQDAAEKLRDVLIAVAESRRTGL
jgi:membrane protein YdbS with pleckstrin-like domain